MERRRCLMASGGVKKIGTFQVYDYTFSFEIGMTWRDWINSKYNTAQASLGGTEVLIISISAYPIGVNTQIRVRADDVIINGYSYVTTVAGGGGSD